MNILETIILNGGVSLRSNLSILRWRIKRLLNLFYFSYIRKKIPNKVIKRNILFIHIPKAAGMSICESLYGSEIGHKRAIDFYRADAEVFKKLKKFTIVRDPYERICSAYNFLADGGMNGYYYDEQFSTFINKFKSFDDFIFNWLSVGKNKYNYMHFIPQTDFLLINGEVSIDKIGKLEDLQSFIDGLNSCWDISLKVSSINKTKTKIIDKTYIFKNEKLRDTIYKLYQKDFELLKYDR